MTRVLIAYGTSNGQSAKIADHLAGVITGRGSEAHPINIKRNRAVNPDDYDAVIVGASICMGSHQRHVLDFVLRNRDVLNRLPSAFFSVSLAAHYKTDESRKEAQGYVEKFLQQSGWGPRQVGLFAGALLYTKYDVITRWIMRRIARDQGNPDTDTSRDYDYTDWGSVRRFAEEFMDTLAPGSARAMRTPEDSSA
jgi:menaquinone-dependent protoporphyrinogen oxidase